MKITNIIGKKICVKCSTKNEYILFLEAAEKVGIEWASGKRPTQHYEFWKNRPIYLYCDREGINGGYLFYDYCNSREYATVNFFDLDLSDVYNKKYQIEIKQKKRSVIATLYDDKGAFVKYAKAVCSPEDEFDFETGKKIALQRLFEIEPKKETEKGTEDCHKMVLENKGVLNGNVGEPTEIEAWGNVKLYVGDVVEVFDPWGDSCGLKCVCKDQSCPNGFVMGVAGAKFENGHSTDWGGWLIIKRKSYKEMNVGDIVDVIEYVPAGKEHNEH